MTKRKGGCVKVIRRGWLLVVVVALGERRKGAKKKKISRLAQFVCTSAVLSMFTINFVSRFMVLAKETNKIARRVYENLRW